MCLAPSTVLTLASSAKTFPYSEKAELFDVAENTLSPLREKCSSRLEDRGMQDPITFIEIGILWIMLVTLVVLVVALGVSKYLKARRTPEVHMDGNRRAYLLEKIDIDSVNYGLNRAGRLCNAPDQKTETAAYPHAVIREYSSMDSTT